MNEQLKNIIPQNNVGKQTDFEHSVTLADLEQARDTFKRAYKRLLNVPVWHELCGAASAEFELTDANGNPAHRLAEAGDHFKIDIVGPGTKAGNGYDWAVVKKIIDNSAPDSENESFALQVSAAKNPQSASGETAHFFTDEATSTFIVERSGNIVTATYAGRNESANNDTGEKIDNLRNSVIAGLALAAGSKLQWDALLKGLLEPEIGG